MAISFNSDTLSTGLKKINTYCRVKGFSGLKLKLLILILLCNDMVPQIKDKVTNAVNNFKDLKTGVTLPEVNIPQLDINAFILNR